MKTTKCFIALMMLAATASYGAAKVSVTENSKKTKLQTLTKKSNRVIGKFRFTKVPEKLLGLQLIVADRGSYNNPGMTYSFKVDKPVTVYLFVDTRIKKAPEGWKKTDIKAQWRVDRIYNDVIYIKDFPAGNINIPGSPAKTLPYCVAVEVKK